METTSHIDFGSYRLSGDRLVSGSTGWVTSNASAILTYGVSNKGPDVGRAIAGLALGGLLGAVFGFLIIGGIIMVAVGAIVIGLVMGLKQVEHGRAYITVDLADGSRITVEGPLDQWQAAQSMTEAINAR